MDTTIECESKLKEFANLISSRNAAVEAKAECDEQIEQLAVLVAKEEDCLSCFHGVDADLARKIDDKNNPRHIDKEHLRLTLSRIRVSKIKVGKVGELLESITSLGGADPHADPEKICDKARSVVDFCTNKMVCEEIISRDAALDEAIKQLGELQRYLKSDKSKLDKEVRAIKGKLGSMAKYADRFKCKSTLKSAQNKLKKIPSNSVYADLALAAEISKSLSGLNKKFEDEYKAASRIYNSVNSNYQSIWSDRLEEFKKKYSFIKSGSNATATDPGFNLSSFEQEAEGLLHTKQNDVQSWVEANKKKAKRYQSLLNSEIIEGCCSYEYFIEWQGKIKQLEHERKKENWMKALRGTWAVVKVLLYIACGVFIIGWYITKFILDIVTDSHDDD